MEKKLTILNSFKEMQNFSKKHLAVHGEKMKEHTKAVKRVNFLAVLLKNIQNGMKKFLEDEGLIHDPVLKTFIPQLRDFMRVTQKTLNHEYEVSE